MQIKTTREIYNQIAKPESVQPLKQPVNSDELLAKTMEHLNKVPQIAPRIK